MFTSALKLPSHRLLRWAAQAIPALLGSADARASFERVDSLALQGGAFRASDSMRLDGAPSMVFMPTYSRAIERLSSEQGAGLALAVRPTRQRTRSAR